MCSKPTNPDAAIIFERTFDVIDRVAKDWPADPVPITVPTLGEVETLRAENEALRAEVQALRQGLGR